MKITRGMVWVIGLVVVSILVIVYLLNRYNYISIDAIKDAITVGFVNALVIIYRLYGKLKETKETLENERIIREAGELFDRLDDTIHDLEETISGITKEQRDKLKEAARKKDTQELKSIIEETKIPKKKKG